MQASVVLAPGAESNPFAEMLATLVRQNLDDHPAKRATLLRMVGRVCIVATDVGRSVTLLFNGGRLEVCDGIVGIPDVTVRATSDHVLQMSLVELAGRFGLPDPRGETTRAIAKASADGAIHVHGMLPNLPLVLRLTRLMSVNEP